MYNRKNRASPWSEERIGSGVKTDSSRAREFAKARIKKIYRAKIHEWTEFCDSFNSAIHNAAVELLQRRFGNKTVVQRAHTNELTNTKPTFNPKITNPRSERSGWKLRRLEEAGERRSGRLFVLRLSLFEEGAAVYVWKSMLCLRYQKSAMIGLI